MTISEVVGTGGIDANPNAETTKLHRGHLGSLVIRGDQQGGVAAPKLRWSRSKKQMPIDMDYDRIAGCLTSKVEEKKNRFPVLVHVFRAVVKSYLMFLGVPSCSSQCWPEMAIRTGWLDICGIVNVLVLFFRCQLRLQNSIVA